MDKLIYLDNAATTPVYPQVAEIINEYNTEKFFNPGARYGPAAEIDAGIKKAKANLLKLLGAQGYEIIFTSGATEANNTVIFGALKKGAELIISEGEHPAVYSCAKVLKEWGGTLNPAPLLKDGTVNLDALEKLITPKTGLVSVIHVNNETGAINDVAEIVRRVKKKNPKTLVHSDGVQAFGKMDINLLNSGLDAYTISAHKIGGPKGMGALIYKKGTNLTPLIYGGGQQGNIRSGTENVSGILGLAEAAVITVRSLNKNIEKYLEYKNIIIGELTKTGIPFKINAGEIAVHGILSVSFTNLKGEVVLHMCEQRGVLIGTGSACSSKKADNRVLRAMGLSSAEIEGSLRISFGWHNTLEEVQRAAKILAESVTALSKTMKGK